MKCKRCDGSGQEPDNKKTGSRLRALRRERGIGLREMARRMGISHPYLCQMEAGDRRIRPALLRQYLSLMENHNQKKP